MTEHLALTDRASSDERSGLGVHASVRLGRVSQMLVGDSDAGGVTRGAEIFCGVGPDPAVDANPAIAHLVVQPLRARQHDPGPQRQRLRRRTSPRPSLQLITLIIGQHQHGLRASRTRHTSFYDLLQELQAHDTRARSDILAGVRSPGRRHCCVGAVDARPGH
jgi:hypothetical protein